MDQNQQMAQMLMGQQVPQMDEPHAINDPTLPGLMDYFKSLNINPANWDAMLKATPPSTNIEDRRSYDPTDPGNILQQHIQELKAGKINI